MATGRAEKCMGLLSVVALLVITVPAGWPGPARQGGPDDPGRDAYFLTLIDGMEPATDSAAAATALSTGTKTDAGNIAWLPGDPLEGALQTIAEMLRGEEGFAIGVASTVPFNHGTPASFVSHNISRGNRQELAHEIVFDVVPDLVIGGGYDTSYFPLDSAEYMALTTGQTSYTHVLVREMGVDANIALPALAAAVDLGAGDKLFGLFGGPGGNFAYHAAADDPGNPNVTRGAIEDPTLATVTEVALEVLSQDPEGFFVLVEQGDIDWSNHANNFESMVGGIWDLDQAVRTAEAWIEEAGGPEWSDTLVIVTADHANGYMQLQRLLGAGDLPLQVQPDESTVSSGWTYPDGDVTYQTHNHTNELVTLWARGQGAGLFEEYAGSWYPQTEIVDNTQIYEVMMRAVEQMGVKNVILFVGDGMHVEHELAASRYLYEQNLALAWHDWGLLATGWAGYCSTWDVATYNKYARALGRRGYDAAGFDPRVGYDPDVGGSTPFHTLPYRVHLPLVQRPQ